ncbi:MAG: hypothetical protein ACR2HI_04250 [Gaiella sp.]
MKIVKRILVGAGIGVAATIYVWGAAVRAVPAVRRRKAARRTSRGGSPPRS